MLSPKLSFVMASAIIHDAEMANRVFYFNFEPSFKFKVGCTQLQVGDKFCLKICG